jgi:hypothetical protein
MNTEERLLQLRKWCKEKASHCPKLKHEIMDLYDLAVTEIEDQQFMKLICVCQT